MRSFMPAYNLIGFDPWVRQLMPQIFNYWTRQGSEGAKKEEGEDRFLMVFGISKAFGLSCQKLAHIDRARN